jgi:hypothetical protein
VTPDEAKIPASVDFTPENPNMFSEEAARGAAF